MSGSVHDGTSSLFIKSVLALSLFSGAMATVNAQGETRWRPEVLGRDGKTPDIILGEPTTYSEAQRITTKWANEHPNDLRLTNEREIRTPNEGQFRQRPKRVRQGVDLLNRLKEAKDAVDHARKYRKGETSLIKLKQRQLGDTIREYGDRLGRSLRQVLELKETLTGGVASQTDAQFRKVNGLIDRYNRDVQGFQAVMGRLPSFRHNGQLMVAQPLEHVSPPPRTQGSDSIVGTAWKSDGYVSQGQNVSGSTLRFLSNGTYVHTTPGLPTLTGSYLQNGNNIAIGAATDGSWRSDRSSTAVVSGNVLRIHRGSVFRKL